MTKNTELSKVGTRRRSILQAAAAAVTTGLVGTNAYPQDKLSGRGEVVVFSYGGSYSQAMRKNVYEPFTKATGINVVDVTADLAEPQIKAMGQAGRVDWDLVLVDAGLYDLRDSGAFVPIDYSIWDEESLKGVPQTARSSDFVVAFQNAIALVYDERAFPRGGPKSWNDFWDVKSFPGPRGLSLRSSHMSIPLAADGVPRSQIYPLTDDKVQRALRKLDTIKPNVAKWWKAGGEPVQALLNKEYAMTSCFDGRALAAIRQGMPLRIVLDRAALSSTYYAILKGGPNTTNAQKLLAYMNRAQVAANFTLGVNLPSPNINQMQYLPADILPLLNNNPQNASKLDPMDLAWFSAKRADGKSNLEHVEAEVTAWRARS